MKVSLLLVTFLALSAAAPAEAQLGGLMRRAREAVKPPETPATPAPAPAAKVPNPFSGAVVPITDDQLARFQKALSYEHAQREDVRNMMAAAEKRVAGYKECTQTAGTSPEAMQIIQDWSEKIANLPSEEGAKAVPQMYGEVAAFVAKKCGEDPGAAAKIRDERMRAIEGEAASIAMGQAAGSSGGSQGSGSASGSAQGSGSSSGSQGGSGGTQSDAGRAYAMLKERIPVFCGGTPSAPIPLDTDAGVMTVVQVPNGSMAYVFRDDETGPLRNACPAVMKLLKPLMAQ